MERLELDQREVAVLALLRREGPLSRRDLHQRMGLRPNTVGEIADALIAAGVLREGTPRADGPGRPSVPLEIDPERRSVVGLALEPGRVTLTRLNLHGRRVGASRSRAAAGARAVDVAAELLEEADHPSTAAVGVSVTGFIDLPRRLLLVSSVAPGEQPVSLEPIFAAAGRHRVVLENDLQALAVRWMLAHEAEVAEDILLVYVRDGAIGAAMLIGGRPNRGSVLGGNELGHTRLPVDTERCYCGHPGCLERIVSSRFLRRRSGRRSANLAEAVRAGADDPHVREIAGHLATGVANAVNLIRPNRIVLASEFNSAVPFTNRLLDEIRGLMLPALAARTRIDLWDRPQVDFSEAAACLGLASLVRAEWLLR